ncbi:hypothetical protein K7432_012200 [Basidiobolus ranarum]|uniref:Peptidase C51 domain-containing protein n=1 Tax=Basidiobolus ranarum TaxID=34480 RepID=A0ABR2WL79_9FUNG
MLYITLTPPEESNKNDAVVSESLFCNGNFVSTSNSSFYGADSSEPEFNECQLSYQTINGHIRNENLSRSHPLLFSSVNAFWKSEAKTMNSLTCFLIFSVWIHGAMVQPVPLYNTKIVSMVPSDSGILTTMLNTRPVGNIHTKLLRRNKNSFNYGGKKSANNSNNNTSNGSTSNGGYTASKSNVKGSTKTNSQSSNAKGNRSQSTGTLQFHFNNGQCTDWADARYAQLTGRHVDWSGDASTWASSARSAAGWTVSSQAKAPSIIALQPGVQGVGSDGHVACVESIESNGDVYTSNYNFNGGPYVKTFVTFKVGSGVSFIWHN